MATWAVEEGTITVTPENLNGAIKSIGLRVDPANTAQCLMEIRTDDAGALYTLRFHRNGVFISLEHTHEEVPPPPVEEPPPIEEPPPEAHATSSHGRSRRGG